MAAVWFITGVSSGFGFQIALQALSASQRVIGTVRNRTRAASEVSAIEAKGGKILELDVTNSDACSSVFKEAESLFGQIDVLVNNAGYSVLGAVEDFGDEESLAQMDTNFFGPQRLIRAALPSFRARKSGTIVNVTSVAGVNPQPSSGLYSASKFALEGLSEALAKELAPFNVTVLLVEPGAFRTNFLSALVPTKESHAKDYPPVQAVLDKFEVMNGKQRGDPAKAAARIVEAVVGEGMAGQVVEKAKGQGRAIRMPLGNDCVERYEQKVKAMQEDLEGSREVAGSTDF